MSIRRFIAVTLLGAGLGLSLPGSIWAEEDPPPAADGAEQGARERDPAPPGPPEGPREERRGEFRRRGPSEAGPFRPGPGGGPGRLGRPGPMGPPEQRGPYRMRYPGGPPRWPFHDWDALEKSDPEMHRLLRDDYELEFRCRELVMQYRRAPAEQRGGVRRQLKDLVDRHFDVRQQRRLLEVKRLEEELQRLREAINQRNEAREELVGERISELLGDETEPKF